MLSSDTANITIIQNNDSAKSNINQCQIYLVLGPGEFIFFRSSPNCCYMKGLAECLNINGIRGTEVQQKLSILRKHPRTLLQLHTNQVCLAQNVQLE